MAKQSKLNITLSLVMATLVTGSLVFSSYAYWQKSEGSFNIPTQGFNATEDEFTYYACVPNVAAEKGYDYYDLEEIPTDLVNRVTALAVVRFEALTTTAYIPAYPKVNVGGRKFNYDNNNPELPVIHILNSLSADGLGIDNGFDNIETLIIPETVTYIQPGSFKPKTQEDTPVVEVSFLGTEKNSGYLDIPSDEFEEVASNKIHFQAKNNYRTTKPYTLTNAETLYTFTQFDGDFEINNLAIEQVTGDLLGEYSTFVIPNQNIASGTQIITSINAPESVLSNRVMNANVKYKITYDGNNLQIDEYTYDLEYNSLSERLVLNTSVNYEEYIIKDNLGTIEINNYPSISVSEYVNESQTSNHISTFNLNKLNASYSNDNNVYEIKYAPSHVYQSKHYASDNGKLIEEETRTQISVEKAYFLNEVTTYTYKSAGEKFLTISVPNDGTHLGLYVKAGFNSHADTYYLDDGKEYIPLTLSSDKTKYMYEFRSTLSPNNVGNNVPDKFVFYEGEYNVISYPSYVSKFENEVDVQNSLTDSSNETTRIYFDLTLKDDNVRALYEDDHYGEDKIIKHYWYLVYWVVINGKETEYKFRIFYADEPSTILIADVPNIADKFKFARIPASTDINDALDDNWAGVTNKNADDLTLETFASKGTNIIEYDNFWGDGSGQIHVNYGTKVTDTKLLLRNKNYLVLNNYGDNIHSTKYIPIDENLGFQSKDIRGLDGNYNLEFLKYANHETNAIQTITLTKGTKLSAKIYDINHDTYFSSPYGYPSDSSSLGIAAKDSTDEYVADISTYFTKANDGSILVMQDCQVEVYLKVDYNSNGTDTTPLDYGWYFQIKSNTLSGIDRTVICDEDNIASVTHQQSLVTLDKITPMLKGVETTPIKLVRNYANSVYEEYIYQNTLDSSKKYVVSNISLEGVSFGGNSNNNYYGVINNSSPSGEIVIPNGSNIITFTPNYNRGYSNTYYAAFDDYDNFLCFLKYNETQSVNEGYQCFSLTLPQTLKDYQNVFIYLVDKDGNKLEENPINSNTNIPDMLSKYNFDSGLTANDQDIVFDQQNELLFDFYLKKEDDDQAEYQTNNLGFSYYVDDNGDKLYYYYNIKLALSTASNGKNRYIITTKDALSTPTHIDNIEDPLDEQIIDGYYYNAIEINGSNRIRFDENVFADGYYNLVLRVRGKNQYLGYQYLGTENKESKYYMHFYQNDVVLEVVEMKSMANGAHYFADLNYTGAINKIEIYNEQGICVDIHEYDGTSVVGADVISRFYYSLYNTIDGTSRLKEVRVGQIGLIYHFGEYHLDTEINVRYSPNTYHSEHDSYSTIIDVGTTEVYSAQFDDKVIYLNEINGFNGVADAKKSFGGYITTTKFNTEVVIKKSVKVSSITIAQPGTYFITYTKTGQVVTCTKVENINELFVEIDEEIISTLIVNTTTSEYFEYIADDYFILQEDLYLVADNEHVAKTVNVLDAYGNLVTTINQVTFEGTKVTKIEAGVYTLKYSIDSARRANDNYMVFTYFNLEKEDSLQATVTYNYKDENGIDTSVTYIIPNDPLWDYYLEDYYSLSTYTGGSGYYFGGWIAPDTKVKENMSKYEINSNELVFTAKYTQRSNRHEVIWISEPKYDSITDVVFSLSKMENSRITSVTYNSVDISKYITISDGRIVTIKSAAFEKIGYVEGGIKLTVNLNYLVNGIVDDTYTCTVTVDYPRLTNKIPDGMLYSSSFSSEEYVHGGSVSNEETIYKAINNTSVDWIIFGGWITGENNANTTEGNYCLRIEKNTRGYGYAITNAMFYNVSSISFDLSSEAYTQTDVIVTLLNSNHIPIPNMSQRVSNTKSNTYENKTITFNYEGVCFIKFEIIDKEGQTLTDGNEIRIDNLALLPKITSVSTGFTADEYNTISKADTANVTTIQSKLPTSPSWTVQHASIDTTGNNSELSNDYGLRLYAPRSGTSGAYTFEWGYAQINELISDVNNISFDLAVSAKTLICVNVIAIDEGGNEINLGQYSNTDIDKNKFKSHQVDCNSLNDGGYYLRFEISFINGKNGTAQDYEIRLDNIKINAN